jgi:hypothetical protein
MPKLDLDHLDEFIEANQDTIHLDKSYNHLPKDQALEQIKEQAKAIVEDFRSTGMPEAEVEKFVSQYLLTPNETTT